jgi:hypothetical protein
MSRRFSLSAWLAALALLLLSMMVAPARSEPAEGVSSFNCYGTRKMASCVESFRSGSFSPHVIRVPAPQSADEVAAADARDRRWAERCRPQIRQDRYGMPRYSYAAVGCEFGRVD